MPWGRCRKKTGRSFAGRNGGISDEANLPDRWSKTENVAWSTAIPGRGWSSPIVWGDRVFLTSAVRLKGEAEKVKPGLYFGGERKTPKDPHRWVVYCLDLNSGKILWEKTAHEGIPKEGHHLKNTLASETPVTDGKHVFAYFGSVGLFAYDMEGNPAWKVSLGDYPMALNWGTASSPVVGDGRVFVVNDNEKHSSVQAFDAESGKRVWEKPRKEKSNWATPFVWKNDLRTELVTCGKNKVRSYSLNGKELWSLQGMSSIVIPTPFRPMACCSLRPATCSVPRSRCSPSSRGLRGTSPSKRGRRRTSPSPGPS